MEVTVITITCHGHESDTELVYSALRMWVHMCTAGQQRNVGGAG
jgi:hypothetical protein